MNLSVLIPAFKAARTISQSIKSALANIDEESEVLVYLDGSDHDMEKVIDSFKDNRLRIIQSSINRGEYYARNALIENAKGKYIAHLDSDDICLKNRFVNQFKFLKKSQADFVFGNAIYLKENNHFLKYVPLLPISLDVKAAKLALVIYDPFVNSTLFSKKTSVLKAGLFIDTPSPDYEYWLRAALNGFKLARQRNYAVIYRVHEGQMTASDAWIAKKENDSIIHERQYSLLESIYQDGLIETRTVNSVLETLFKLNPRIKFEILGTLTSIKEILLRHG